MTHLVAKQGQYLKLEFLVSSKLNTSMETKTNVELIIGGDIGTKN